MITLPRKRLLWFVCLSILAVFVFRVSLALAITITFDPGTPSATANGGSLASTPGTVMVGEVASYVSGGNGVTGIATCYPSGSACDPGGVSVPPSAAASTIDHYWLQFDPPIVFSFTSPQSQVVAVAGIDHGPLPGEALEFIVWGSSDGTTLSEEGAITAVFDDGVDGSIGAAINGPSGSTNIGLSDDLSSVWSFSNSWSYFIVTAGDHIAGFTSAGEGEIDGLASLNQPPDCSNAAPSRNTVWPPNHEFMPISITGVTDPDGDAISLNITSIFQDEPVKEKGGGNASPDGQGVNSSTAEVRAERSAKGDGRVYHISYTADDGRGGTCSGEVLVGVPHDQESTPVDGGALFDSTTS